MHLLGVVELSFNPMLQRDTNPAHWIAIFYYNPGEPRLFVRSRMGTAFTVNFAKPAAWAIIGVIVALIAFAFAVNSKL